MAVWLLGLYEVRGRTSQIWRLWNMPLTHVKYLCYRPWSVDSRVLSPGWGEHNQGLETLLKLRNPENYATQDGRNLFWIVLKFLVSFSFPVKCLAWWINHFSDLLSHQQNQFEKTRKECPEETLIWIGKIYQHCQPSEYPLLRAGIFAHHCTRLCSRFRRIIDAGNSNELLLSSSSIFQEMDRLEEATDPLSDERTITNYAMEPPLGQSAIPVDAEADYKKFVCALQHIPTTGLVPHAGILASCIKSSMLYRPGKKHFRRTSTSSHWRGSSSHLKSFPPLRPGATWYELSSSDWFTHPVTFAA